MIPKILHHIWIGPKKMPTEWMNTWVEKHPHWKYILWDNYSLSTIKFKNQELIDLFFSVNMFDGAADLMRYELLYEYGGFMPGADSECLHPIDELTDNRAITVYENEKLAGHRTSPILGSEKNYPFLRFLIDYFYDSREKIKYDLCWYNPPVLVGNYIIGDLIKEHNPDGLLILPSNAFIGEYLYDSVGYYDSRGFNKRYAVQYWGTGRGLYVKP